MGLKIQLKSCVKTTVYEHIIHLTTFIISCMMKEVKEKQTQLEPVVNTKKLETNNNLLFRTRLLLIFEYKKIQRISGKN